jgi:hypothetical protein
MNYPEYEEPSTPDLADLQQEEESDALIEIPVRVVDIGPVQVHQVPSRDAVMRNVIVSDVQQIVGANLRRRSITVWATADTASGYVYIGTDKNEVESGTTARLPALVDTYTDGAPVTLTMTHALQIWVANPGVNPVTVSFVSEDWAD